MMPIDLPAGPVAAGVAAHRPDLVWCCPQLPASPTQAMADVLDRIAEWPWPRMAVIGSSLGGFYATAVAERTGCRAVLLNPAVDPARDLAKHIGETRAWHSEERFFFRAEYVAELQALEVPRLSAPERYLAVIAKGDEVLSWQEMTTRHAGATFKLLEGGDHALSDFHEHLPDVIAFLELDAPPA
jgi:predicted esterase YcpF (UPF0227 family)